MYRNNYPISHNGRNGRQPQTSQLHERVDHLLAAGWCAKHPTSWHTRQHPEGLKDLYIFYRFLWISWLFLHIEDLKYLKIEWNWLISSKLARSSNSIPSQVNEENEHTKWRDKDKERPLVNLQLQPGLAGPWLKSLHYWCRPWSPTSCPDATHAQSTLGREGWQGSSRKSYWSNKCFKIIKSKIHYHPWCSKHVSSRILICMISIDIQC